MARKKGIPGLSFSWKRATGLSSAKGKLSRQLGVPLTRAGRQRKVGKSLGCCLFVILVLAGGWVGIGALAKVVSLLTA
jgi:hypothetical protein